MKPKVYSILSQAVEDGAKYGYRRAFKHCEAPTEEAICDSIHLAIMNEISQWFEFEEGDL